MLEYCDIHERKFEKWSMAHARIDELTESIILKYSASKVFAPFSMTAKQALGFIEDMAKEREEHLAHEVARLFKVPDSHAHA